MDRGREGEIVGKGVRQILGGERTRGRFCGREMDSVE